MSQKRKAFKNGCFQLAQSITERLLKIHKNKILAVGIFGSVANNTHGPYSDIDLIVVIRSKTDDRFFILVDSNNNSGKKLLLGRDIKLSLFFKTKQEILNQLSSIDNLSWLIKVAMVLNTLPIHDPKDIFSNFQKIYEGSKSNSSCIKQFNRLAGRWLSVAYEFLGKINKPNLSRDEGFIYAERFAFAIASVYKALNKDFFKNTYKIVHEIERLPRKHQRVVFLIKSLLVSRNIEAVHKISTELWLVTSQYARSRRVKIECYTEAQLDNMFKTLC